MAMRFTQDLAILGGGKAPSGNLNGKLVGCLSRCIR